MFFCDQSSRGVIKTKIFKRNNSFRLRDEKNALSSLPILETKDVFLKSPSSGTRPFLRVGDSWSKECPIRTCLLQNINILYEKMLFKHINITDSPNRRDCLWCELKIPEVDIFFLNCLMVLNETCCDKKSLEINKVTAESESAIYTAKGRWLENEI